MIGRCVASNGVRLLLVIALFGAGRRAACESPVTLDVALHAACQYLWSQQAEDGGWHSDQYAVLRSGQALTPFVIHTLLNVPESTCPRPAGGVDLALDFIRNHVDREGALGRADPDIAEYPVYSTAYGVLCLAKVGNERDRILAGKMVTYLVKAQFLRHNGFDPNMPAFGGWGFDSPREPGNPGHMDLAHTRRALEAINAHWAKWLPQADRATLNKELQMFLRVVQRHPDAVAAQPRVDGGGDALAPAPCDGGFYFSPVVLAANKGGVETDANGAKYFRSYASATCEGVLALVAAGVSHDDERLATATDWLGAHGDLDYPQGIPTDGPEPWGEAIRFYHYAVRAEAYRQLRWPGDWRDELTTAIAKHQADDGSYRNLASQLMKEDDPLVATTLAVVALSHCLP